jgi:hypothetical protein
MKAPAIDQLVYSCMFPKPKATDPQNFQGLLQRQLVPEVRLETQAFYGHLSSQEAKYPGLDYSYQPHRVRLSRYTWHRRLFRAFDNLGLTKSEIASLTKWEGTRWAKERFEREQGIVIRDTTSVSFPPFISLGFESPGSLSGAATTSIVFVFEKPKQPLEPPRVHSANSLGRMVSNPGFPLKCESQRLLKHNVPMWRIWKIFKRLQRLRSTRMRWMRTVMIRT